MMENEKYSRELNVGVRVVHMACELCQKLQQQLLLSSTNLDQVRSKDDDSLVTVADWSVQATVSLLLSQNLGDQNISIVAEEDSHTLSNPESTALLAMVVNAVNECLSKAPRFGFQGPSKALGASQILDAISQCNSNGGPSGRHWVLDPVDGTLGFVRGDQYAIALAMIEDGEVVLGVLGCPNYPVKDDALDMYSQQNHVRWEISSREVGCVMYTQKHTHKAWMQPLINHDKMLEWPNYAKLIRVSSVDDPAQATFCEPVENNNSDHSFAAGVANTVGLRCDVISCSMIVVSYFAIQFFCSNPEAVFRETLKHRKKPLRVHSMVKYGAIARGEAEIYMKFAKSGYKEKIWDHAAGVLLVQEAGGVVTDAAGRPLDFSGGIYLESLDRGLIACCGSRLHQKIIAAVYASGDSSNL